MRVYLGGLLDIGHLAEGGTGLLGRDRPVSCRGRGCQHGVTLHHGGDETVRSGGLETGMDLIVPQQLKESSSTTGQVVKSGFI